jgi:hypothetical protein
MTSGTAAADQLDAVAPPSDVTARLQALDAALDKVIPVKQLDRNLLVATWNLRAFAGLTKNWESEPQDSPKRNLATSRRSRRSSPASTSARSRRCGETCGRSATC